MMSKTLIQILKGVFQKNLFVGLYFTIVFISIFIFYNSFLTIFTMIIDSKLLWAGAAMAIITAVLFAYRFTHLAYFILFFCLAFSGHAPWHKYTLVLLFLVTSLSLGVHLKLLLDKQRLESFIDTITKQNIFYVITLYLVVGFVASLVAIGSDIQYLEYIIVTYDLDKLFMLEVAVYTTLVASIGVYVLGTLKSDVKEVGRYIQMIFFGFLFSLAVGYLSYFGIIDIFWFSDPDGSARARFASMYQNSTWYAEYIAVVLPLSLVLFRYYTKSKFFFFFYLGLVILMEVALIFAIQRGAWMSYPFTLLSIWIAIYFMIYSLKNPDNSMKDFFKASWLKIIVTTPVTIVASLVIVYMIKENNLKPIQTFNTISSKAQNVVNDPNRTALWKPAISMVKASPLYGNGSGSFGYMCYTYYYDKGFPNYIPNSYSLHLGAFGTAHNIYLQDIVGKGIIGLVLLLLLIGITLKSLVVTIIEKKQDYQGTILSIALFSSMVSIAIYGFVQEIFQPYSVQIIFWMVIVLASIISKKVDVEIKLLSRYKKLFLLLLLLLPIHLLYSGLNI